MADEFTLGVFGAEVPHFPRGAVTSDPVVPNRQVRWEDRFCLIISVVEDDQFFIGIGLGLITGDSLRNERRSVFRG
jgi:hypothetical protein